jgi:molybdopterin biosynthesis enzyme MoaB
MSAHNDSKTNLILTSGGTGFTPRDVTPEATESLLTKKADSLTQYMLAEAGKITPMACLSRCQIGVIVTENE